LSENFNGLGIIQGGGFYANNGLTAVKANAAINNEFNVSKHGRYAGHGAHGSAINSATPSGSSHGR